MQFIIYQRSFPSTSHFTSTGARGLRDPFSIRRACTFCAPDRRRSSTSPIHRTPRRSGTKSVASANRKFVDNGFAAAGNVSRSLCLPRLYPATTKAPGLRQRLSTATGKKRNARRAPSSPRSSPSGNNSIDDRSSCTNICKLARGSSRGLVWARG